VEPHWRDQRIVRTWPDLVGRVTRWQAVAGQNWSQGDIDEVAVYLNERFYKLPAPGRS
jgi:hypothetical protein